jgi:hypothetical protein
LRALGIERRAHDDPVARAERQVEELDTLRADRLHPVHAIERVAHLDREHEVPFRDEYFLFRSLEHLAGETVGHRRRDRRGGNRRRLRLLLRRGRRRRGAEQLAAGAGEAAALRQLEPIGRGRLRARLGALALGDREPGALRRLVEQQIPDDRGKGTEQQEPAHSHLHPPC